METKNSFERKEEEPPDSYSFSKRENLLLSKKELPKRDDSFFVAKNNNKISYKINKNHFKIRIFDKFEYQVKYPKAVFANFGEKEKETLLDNFVYCRTLPMSLISNPGLFYQTTKPSLKGLIDYGLLKDLPYVSEVSKTKSVNTFKKLFNRAEIIFQKENLLEEKLAPSKKCSKEKGVLSISFGKDSLLSYALLKEIGFNYHLVSINDMEKYNFNEFKLKKEIIKMFSEEQKEKVIVLTDETDNIFHNKEIKNNIKTFDRSNAMLAFALEIIPLAYYFEAKYIIFGSEKNLDSFFVNSENFRVYPSSDQSSDYMRKGNQYLKDLTSNNIEVISLIKPLYNIAEIKILHHRYPHLLKYVMSCSDSQLKNYRWCESCSTCCREFIAAAAVGNPQKVGLNKNFLEKKYLKFYPLFNPEIDPYDRPPDVRDEQLLAFFLAYKNGYQGDLISLFEKLHLKEAQKREKKLREKFFSWHSTKTIPVELKDKVLKIFKEELKDLI
ncbi:MAG: hypothetical protein QMC93_02295 [Patescibacteria group bacterium]|nr:hypothetical protein [Patescibacteria group bacterium]